MARSTAHLHLVPDPSDVPAPGSTDAHRSGGDDRIAAGPGSPGERIVTGPEPLWREVLGAQLRARRRHRGERLADVADRAGVSPQYLSEIERGRKEPSSEMIGAIGRALGTDLAGLALGVVGDLRRSAGRRSTGPSGRPTGPTALLRAA